MQNTDNIIKLLETIQSFQIVQCQMLHEKVAIGDDKKPISKSQDDTLVFDRASLCEIKHRNKRLGCAHSGVNINFERALEHLTAELPQCVNQISDFKNEFKSVVTKIYMIDHKVGNLEHDIAVCMLTFDDDGIDKLEQSMRVLKAEHRRLMNCLSKIKTDIEQLIKIELNYSTL